MLAEVVGVSLVVARDANLFTVDESVHLIWRTFHVHFIHHLLHLGSGKRIVAQFVYLAVVVVDDACPVLDKLLLRGVLYHLVPSVVKKMIG